jgi:two-component system chemotaxis response regulator CheB
MINAERRPRSLIVIGASAGGMTPLIDVCAAIPADIPAAVAVVVHLHPLRESRLGSILALRSAVKVVQTTEPRRLEHGTVYVAPPDMHMQLVGEWIRFDRGPRAHYTRPAVDPLFTSAAKEYGAGVVGVLLSGRGQDGVAGLIAIKACGGISLVQDPAEAEFPSMPQSAMEKDHVDAAVPAARLPAILTRLARGGAIDVAGR